MRIQKRKVDSHSGLQKTVQKSPRNVNQHHVSPRHRRREDRDGSPNSMSPIHRYHERQRRNRSASRSRRRSRSWSPEYYREGRRHGSRRNYEDERRSPRYGSHCHGSQYSKGDYERDGLHRCRRDTSDVNNEYECSRSPSPYRSRKQQRRSRSLSKSKSPSVALRQHSNNERFANDKELQIVKREEAPLSSPAMDRRTRRYKQSVRETEKSHRQSEGKKPYFLIVDRLGKPYGSGKRAWTAEINKLATWLDPSCTHIRKQSYDDVCIFKDRLNDKFEYSRDLSDDHLRALMGKAVTKKRTELIALIKRDGSKPLNMDAQVWKRLEKLASSEQRETRSEHGRFANACRKTFGRTGPLGVQGIREKLREEIGRSPDPDEIGEEMQRDKGFSKKEKESQIISKERGKGVSHEFVDEDRISLQSQMEGSDDYSSDKGHYDSRKSACEGGMKRNEEVSLVVHKGMHSGTGREGMSTTDVGLPSSKKLSKDEYILRLESELRSLRGEAQKGSSSRTVIRSDLSVCLREDNDELPVRYLVERSDTIRNGHVKLRR